MYFSDEFDLREFFYEDIVGGDKCVSEKSNKIFVI